VAPQRTFRSYALHSGAAVFNRANNRWIAAHFKPWAAQPTPKIQAVHAIYASANTGLLFSICVNLRNLRINLHPQISQIYADKDKTATHGL
jgi:lipoprotein signal peptidase